jgi:two-component system sensor histidine kinase/response regulator
MTSLWLIALAGFLFLVTIGLLIASYSKLRKQNFLIKLQSREIETRIRELTDQNRLGEELIREKRQLILLVSHDLKGPFNRLYALMQLLELESANLTPGQREYLGKMYQIVGDGLNMVRNLVDARKLEERGVDPQPEQLNVTAVVNAIVNQYRVPSEKKSIRVHFDETAAIESITDRNSLSRIVENLLSNAVKFSSANDKVYVTLRQIDGRVVEICVRDEGPGISAEDQAKLYRKFQKLTPKPTGGESSTGLGLSIVKQLVSAMGGSITCTSAPGEGSTFCVRLPRMEIKAGAEPATGRGQLNK